VNVVISEVKRFLGHPSPVQVVKDKKQLENVEYFNYLGSLKTHDATCTHEEDQQIELKFKQ
jgi:hypothetical protein